MSRPGIRGNADALDVLRANPLIGRACGNSLRELVIGRGAHGCIALYRYAVLVDTVFVLAIRAQREAGYAREARLCGVQRPSSCRSKCA